jgi:hypothetical protein
VRSLFALLILAATLALGACNSPSSSGAPTTNPDGVPTTAPATTPPTSPEASPSA